MSLRGKCIDGRWLEDVMECLPDGEIVYSRGTKDYQGAVAFVARLDDGRWLHCEWAYGSCSGCDQFEDMDEPERRDAFRRLATTMDAPTFGDYLVGCMASRATWFMPDDCGEWACSYSEHTGLSSSELLEMVMKEIKS